jgi:hypothetical protein
MSPRDIAIERTGPSAAPDVARHVSDQAFHTTCFCANRRARATPKELCDRSSLYRIDANRSIYPICDCRSFDGKNLLKIAQPSPGRFNAARERSRTKESQMRPNTTILQRKRAGTFNFKRSAHFARRLQSFLDCAAAAMRRSIPRNITSWMGHRRYQYRRPLRPRGSNCAICLSPVKGLEPRAPRDSHLRKQSQALAGCVKLHTPEV